MLVDCTPDMKVVREEIFGPVLVVSKFSTEEEALKLANGSTYGLGAAVFTGVSVVAFGKATADFVLPGDAKQAMRVSGELQAGSVWVNQYGILHASVPFGGFKQSGIGRELGGAGVHEYTTVRPLLGVVSDWS